MNHKIYLIVTKEKNSKFCSPVRNEVTFRKSYGARGSYLRNLQQFRVSTTLWQHRSVPVETRSGRVLRRLLPKQAVFEGRNSTLTGLVIELKFSICVLIRIYSVVKCQLYRNHRRWKYLFGPKHLEIIRRPKDINSYNDLK